MHFITNSFKTLKSIQCPTSDSVQRQCPTSDSVQRQCPTSDSVHRQCPLLKISTAWFTRGSGIMF